MKRQLLALTLAAPLLVACQGEPPSSDPIRLVDVFGEATVTGTPPTASAYAPTEWTFDEGAEGWSGAAAVRELSAADGALRAQVGARSVLTAKVDTEAPDDDVLHAIEVRARVSEGTTLEVRFGQGETLNLPATLGNPFGRFRTPLRPGDEVQTYQISVPATVQASAVQHVLLLPTDADAAELELDSLRLVFRTEHLAEVPAGIAWYGLDERYREALATRAPEKVEITRRLPTNPVFNTSVGTLTSSAITFTATATNASGETLEATVDVSEPNQWQPLALDLGDWAGDEVTLALHTDGEAGDVGFWGSPVVRSRNDAGDRPQGVILVIADTLRMDHLDLYGYERSTAPNLEAMATEGVAFDDAISQATWTKVSVPAIQTSMYPTSHTVADIPDRLPPTAKTIAEIYRDAGYSTLALTSIPFVGRLTNLHQGYEEMHEGASVDRDLGAKTAAEHVARLETWLDERGDGPFFVLLHISDPHSPYRPLPEYDTTYSAEGEMDRLDDLIEQVRPEIKHHPLMQRFGMPRREELVSAGIDPEEFVRLELDGYDASIRGLDDAMGQLRGTLERLGLEDDVLVGLVSDHGTEFLEHDAHFHGHTAYGELNRVPLFFWGPGFVEPQQTVRHTVQTIDLMPTLLELSQLQIPEAAQGQSLLPLFADPESPWDRPAITELPMNMRGVTSKSIIQGGWKLIRYDDPGAPRYELFSHADDPLNHAEVAADNPEVVARLQQVLENWQKFAAAGRLSAVEATESMSAEELERLRSLGYL